MRPGWRLLLTAPLLTKRLAFSFASVVVAAQVSVSDLSAQQWDGGPFRPAGTIYAEPPERIYPELTPQIDLSLVKHAASSANVAETEPNNSLLEHDSIAFGDVVSGIISESGDFDYYGFDLQPGDIVDVDIDAFAIGSPLDPIIAFYRIDTIVGANQPIDTVIVQINDNAFLLDSRIVWAVDKPGRYFLGLTDANIPQNGSANHTYTVNLTPRTSDETGSNDDPASAHFLALGDTAFGFINPLGDTDFYAVDLAPGTSLNVDADALDVGSPLLAALRVFDTDGTTLLNFSAGSQDVQVRFFTPTGGRFFVEISDWRGPVGSPSSFYTIKVDTIPTGPGDPTTLFATGFGRPGGLAAGPDGELYVADLSTGAIWRVPADLGPVVELARVPGLTDLTIDGFGDVLATGFQFQATISRISRDDGEVSLFTDVTQFPGAITVGPDGDIWTSDPQADLIWRFDPRGAVVDSFPVGVIGLPILDLAFSPGGELHASNRSDKVFKIIDGEFELAFVAGVTAEGMAFDQNGSLYLGNGLERRIALYDSSYQSVDPEFAITNLGGPLILAFGRETDGSMSSRLFVANNSFGILPPFAGGIVELNPSGIASPGFRKGVDILLISKTPLDTGVVGSAYADTLTIESFSESATWSLDAGELPAGLVLALTTGAITGVPEENGTFDLVVRAESGNRFGTAEHALEIVAPAVAGTDFVDELLGVAGLLGEPLRNFLDITGNKNGTLDIGDLRVFLRSNQISQTAGTTPPATTRN